MYQRPKRGSLMGQASSAFPSWEDFATALSTAAMERLEQDLTRMRNLLQRLGRTH
jgi:hypothetical protein